MPGFSGATGVPLKQMQDAIAQSTADEAKSYDINGTTWGTIYTQLSKVQLSIPACCSIGGQTMALLTGNKTSFAATGMVKCVNKSSGVYEFLVTTDLSQSVYTWRISNFTSASATPTIGNIAIYQSTAFDMGQLNSSIIEAGGTAQIPNVSSMSGGLLVITVRRWGYVATKTIPVRLFKNSDVAQHLIFRDTSAANSMTELSISNTGLITCISTTNGVFIDAVYIQSHT